MQSVDRRSMLNSAVPPQVSNWTSAFAAGLTHTREIPARDVLALDTTSAWKLNIEIEIQSDVFSIIQNNVNNLRDRNCIPRVSETCLNSCSQSSSYRNTKQ